MKRGESTGGEVMKGMFQGILSVIVAALLAVGTGCGAQLTAEERIEAARGELAQGEAAAAAIHMRNVLQDDPSNVEARLLLAEAALATGDVESAAKEFSRALDLGAEIENIRLPYAEALVRAGALDDALRVTDPSQGDASPGVTYWRGLALLRSGKLEEAERALARVRGDEEFGLLADIAYGGVILQRGQPGEALAWLDGLPEAALESGFFWEQTGFAARQLGDHERVVTAFEKAETLTEDVSGRRQLFHRAGRIEALLALGRLDEARALAEQVFSRATDNPMTNLMMGRVELQAGNPQQALAHAQATLAALPRSPQGLMLAAMAHLALGQEIQAEQNLARAVAANPDDLNARRLLAQVRLDLQSPEGALEALGPMTDDALDSGAGRIAGLASVRAGDPEAAVEIFRRQLEQSPDDNEVRSMLAVSLMAAGRVDEALGELGRISGSDAATRQQAEVIKVAAHLQASRPEEARSVAQGLAAEHADDASLRVTLGGLFLAAGELEDAKSWLEDGLRLDPANLAAHFNLGRMAAARGDLDASRGHFASILDEDADNAAALAALAQLDWAAGERDRAVGHLQRARAANPGNAEIRVLLVSYLSAMGQHGAAIEAAREAVAAAPGSAAAANALGIALIQNRQAREALPEFARAHQLEPTVPIYLLNRARAELGTNQLEAARESLVSVLGLSPDNFDALLLVTEVDRRLGRLEDAARSLVRLERIASEGDTRVALLRGELGMAREDYEGAERAFAEALAGDAGSRAVIGLFRARLAAGRADPEAPLDAWLERNPDDAGVRVTLGTHYINTGDHARAIPHYEKLLATAPDNPAFMNNLAWLYGQVGDDRAVAIAERAYARAPDNPMVADTLGWILHQRGDNERALELISKAAEAAPRVGEIQYHHAVVLAALGQTERAVRAARAVLAEPAAMNYHKQAQELLDRLGQGR